jgi:hypothetical protein
MIELLRRILQSGPTDRAYDCRRAFSVSDPVEKAPRTIVRPKTGHWRSPKPSQSANFIDAVWPPARRRSKILNMRQGFRVSNPNEGLHTHSFIRRQVECDIEH